MAVIAVLVEQELKDSIEKRAELEDRTVSQVVRLSLKKYLETSHE